MIKKERWDGRSRIPTKQYKENYDEIFGKKEENELKESYEQSKRAKKEREEKWDYQRS